MVLFKGIRFFFGRTILKNRRNKIRRIKKFNNLRNSHKIGIVWDGSKPDDFDSISSFYQDMQNINIQVDIVCYYPDKVLPDKYTAIRYLNCFKQSDLNLFFIPQVYDINEFINTPYEILIDINNNEYFPLEFITTLSRAEFKVGHERLKYKDQLDMTMSTDKANDPAYYLEQVKYYLEMINTGT